ncbi:enoyl-CoA hydratase [Paraburkholderia sp. JHI869]|uniref:enoyl-CoA hydratase n=1 Tax=Paraburkholderia sp. JHI869 TaxID=3112959 RepID=UPI0031757752
MELTTELRSSEGPGHIRASVTEGIGWITLANPTKHNAVSLSMARSLVECLREFSNDQAVRCVVIRGEGDRAFCTGSDISEKQDIDTAQAAENASVILAAQRAVRSFSKPILAMVFGYCLGGGLAIALGCDLRLAGTGASFGIPAAKLGLSYYYQEMKLLTDLVGPSRCKLMTFTGDRITADRALQIGLVDDVVPAEQLLSFVTDLARRIASNAPLSVAAAKYAVEVALSDAATPDVAGCDARARACLSSEDYAEGRRAFREKRPPRFQGY